MRFVVGYICTENNTYADTLASAYSTSGFSRWSSIPLCMALDFNKNNMDYQTIYLNPGLIKKNKK